MKSNEGREPIVLHQVPISSELQTKALIIKLLPGALLRTDDILLRRKEGKYQAFVMVPSSKVEEICNLKELTNGNDKIFVRKWYSNYQVFVGRLPESVSANDVISSISSQFGKITKYEEVQPHEGSKNKFRHLYLQFERQEDGQNCLFSPQKLIFKNHDLRVARPYAVGENEQTDKKLFIKVAALPQQNQQAQKALNNYFRKQGKLRQKIRLEAGKGPITFTSSEAADSILKNFKGSKIDKFQVVLRPFANYKDSFVAFMSSIHPSINEIQLQEYLHDYEPIVSCKINSNNPKSRNATVTFGSEDSYRRILAEYKTNEHIRDAFQGVPYVTVHMSAKDRNDYNNYKGKGKIIQPKQPIGFPLDQPYFPQQPLGFGFPPQMPIAFNPNMRVPLPGDYRK